MINVAVFDVIATRFEILEHPLNAEAPSIAFKRCFNRFEIREQIPDLVRFMGAMLTFPPEGEVVFAKSSFLRDLDLDLELRDARRLGQGSQSLEVIIISSFDGCAFG